MALVPGYEYDVFVSYAHADEAADSSGKWVTQFVDSLRGALKLRLGGANELRIFFDSASLGGNQQLNEMLAVAGRSAVFLAVASRSYAARDWTRQELDAFCQRPEDTQRLFAAECLPLGDDETYPAPLQNHHRMPFWRVLTASSSTPIPLSQAYEPEVFHQRIHDLAEQIRNQLLALRKQRSREIRLPAAMNLAQPAAENTNQQAHSRRILLAQVTDDLEDDRDQLRRYLEQCGLPIVPAASYPQGGDAFKAAFRDDLAQANLFVQLLGKQPGRAPPDLTEGYTRFQYEAAAAQGIEIVQWRRPDLNLDDVTNPQQRALLAGETVIATGLESFKAEVLRRARRPSVPQHKSSRPALVFINADKEDADIAKILQAEFGRHHFAAVVPTLDGMAEEVRADLEENIIECDALVLVYGHSTPVWVRGQLRLYNKLKARRTEPPRLLALYTGPPPTKPDIGFTFPDVRQIDCRSAVTLDPVRALIEELAH
jgi:CheY-like chemotaxis protein